MPKPKGKSSIFLDVDPSIIEKNMMICKDKSFEQEIKSIFPTTDFETTVIKPLPGFCIKSWILDQKKKAFINICHTDAIPPPDDISEAELLSSLQSDNPSAFRIPMSIGEQRNETDKSGECCTAFDIAISGVFYKKIETNKVFKQFFMTVVFEGIQNKYDIELETEEYVVLKNRKCVGNLQPHRIQNKIVEKAKAEKNKPLIEEITENKEKSNTTEMDFQLIREPREGKIEYLVAEFKINKSLTVDDIVLDVGDDRIVVETPKSNQRTDIFLPYFIKQETARAALNMNTNILIVTMAARDHGSSGETKK